MNNKILKNQKILGKPNLNKKTKKITKLCSNTRRAYVFNNRRPQKIPKKFFGPPKINLIFNFACQRWEKLKTTVHREGLLKKKVIFSAFFFSLGPPGSPSRRPKGYSCHLWMANLKTNGRATRHKKLGTAVPRVW